MECKKYTLTNIGPTPVNFNYRRCDDLMWKYQVTLNPNQVKNIWLIEGTYHIPQLFQSSVILIDDDQIPPTPTPETIINPILVGNNEYLSVGNNKYLMY